MACPASLKTKKGPYEPNAIHTIRRNTNQRKPRHRPHLHRPNRRQQHRPRVLQRPLLRPHQRQVHLTRHHHAWRFGRAGLQPLHLRQKQPDRQPRPERELRSWSSLPETSRAHHAAAPDETSPLDGQVRFISHNRSCATRQGFEPETFRVLIWWALRGRLATQKFLRILSVWLASWKRRKRSCLEVEPSWCSGF